MVDYDQLLELAEQGTQPAAGAPRQAVLRRSVSTAYYAVFHALLGRVATTFVKAEFRKSRTLFYRALDHNNAKTRCVKAGKTQLDNPEKSYFGFSHFSAEIQNFANAFVQLQKLRHDCDYDPDFKIAKASTIAAIETAREAIENLATAQAQDDEMTTLFLTYLLFGLRS